jgi:beta-glucosidase
LKLNEEDLSFYDDKLGAWTYEKGEFKVLIGSSIQDIRLEGVFNYK